MELNLTPIDTPPRAAATVVMLRDVGAGPEVLLMRRHGLSDVLGGAFVFPGGKLDAADAELDAVGHLDQPPDALHASLHDPALGTAQAAGLYVAAVREAFEESGVLLAEPLAGGEPDLAQATSLLKAGTPFNAILAQLGLRLQTRRLVPWSRWITPRVPSVMNKRFDTRFFVAAVVPEQVAQHDDFETTESVWLTPRAALQRYWDGAIEMAPPQIMTLAQLSRHASVDAVLAAARTGRPPLIQPESLEDGGTRVVCYPGDACHPVQERAMQGPTRLRWQNKRFEPVDGFEALFQ
ncbi:NUDIX hydrolase [Pseudorhodoferax sp. Leaf267]|uniref:NUDIX hydrolase n=1 Tax=Pseudorhodoferax sp. Leaf267 TaxID=1736316 RepID=UPI000701B93A|nr:NUDIX hydrolase [Pseudorhodoferax sp. Leaf267]KQP17831.1 NUDIX hydrolase [Pseudorhodoferax sp. Leaf267]